MPEAEELYEQQLNEQRAQQKMAVKPKSEPVTFPWLMLIVAIIFDLLGFIPFVNIVTDIIACFILWFWKHSYNSKTNPLIDIVAAKIVDFLFVGMLPSSTFTVIYSYIKKKTASVAGSKVGGRVIAKLAT